MRTVKIKAVFGAGSLSATETVLCYVLRKGEILNACVAKDRRVDELSAMRNRYPLKLGLIMKGGTLKP